MGKFEPGIAVESSLARWLLGVALALIGVLPVGAWARLQVDDGAFTRATIAGVALSPRADLEQRLRQRADAFANEPVTIIAGPYQVRRTRSELGATLDVQEAHARAIRLGRSGHPIDDLRAYVSAARSGVELPWPPRIARDRLALALAAVQTQVERPPVPGSHERNGALIAGIPGQTVNSVQAIEQLEQALRGGANFVQLAVVAVDPPTTLSYAQVQKSRPDELLYAAETLYPGDSSGRSRNIELAVSALDHTVIEPGAEFSFNERVGERSHARGFAAAKELANRRVVEGVGGGVCQVAATVHAAAFLSAMDITVYQPHSRPVSYIPLGLDTMVSWPNRDLRFRNPYPFPVTLLAFASEKLVRVELRGAGRPHPVQWSTRVLERVPAPEQTISEPSLRRGETRLVQDAIDGLLVERTRTISWPSGPQTIALQLRYPATPRLIAVGAFRDRRHGTWRALGR